MSASAVNRLLRRRRRHLAALAVVLALSAAVAAHHMPVDHIEKGDLGMDEHMMGMDMSADMLKRAKPFDARFIEMMIPIIRGPSRWLA